MSRCDFSIYYEDICEFIISCVFMYYRKGIFGKLWTITLSHESERIIGYLPKGSINARIASQSCFISMLIQFKHLDTVKVLHEIKYLRYTVLMCYIRCK